MNVPAAAIRGDRLCVTPQHEDEGYLSPSEEDLKKSSLARQCGHYVDCKSSNGTNLSGRRTMSSDGYFEEGGVNGDIPWEKLACMPDIREEHLSWDRLKLPVPYRFYDEHRLCLRQVRKAPPPQVSYITDSIEQHAEVIDNIWRFSGPEQRSKQDDVGEQSSSDFAVMSIKAKNEPPSYISMSQFVIDVIQLLYGRESLSFSLVPGERFTFMKNPTVLVNGWSPGLLVNISATFLTAGKIFKRLNHISEFHFDEKVMEREGFQKNAVFVEFLKFTSQYLQLYQTCLMLQATKNHTIASLNIFFKVFYYQLQTLEWILDLYISTDQITLLTGLNAMMLTCETPFLADLIRGAFITCAGVYLRDVSQWIFRGQISEGFHIQKSKSSTYKDRRFWVRQFSQVTSVPAFMEDAVNATFETGKAINLLSLISQKEPSTTLISCILYDVTVGSAIQPALEFKEVVALEEEWSVKVASFFEEYSFLQTDVEAALSNAGEDKKSIIDFDAVEEAKQAFEAKNFEKRQNIFAKKLEKQKWLMNALNEQMAEKQLREKQEKEKEILEDEKISVYNNTRDQRDLQEELRLMKKHFGEEVSETVGLRNVKERIAATEVKPTVEAEHADVPGQISVGSDNKVMGVSNENQPSESNDASVNSELTSFKEEEISKIWNVESHHEEASIFVSSTRSAKEACFLPYNREDTIDNILKNNNVESVNENEERFNPDNLKVRDPNPYNLNLDFDFLLTGLVHSKPALKVQRSLVSCEDEPSTTHQPNIEESTLIRHDSFCVNFFLNQSLTVPVKAQNRMINSALLHYFIVEKRLFHHVEVLHSYLCLQNGQFGHFLTSSLIQEIKKGRLRSNNSLETFARLSDLLGEAVAHSAVAGAERNDKRDHLEFVLERESNRYSLDLESQKSVKSKMLTSAYEVLNDFTLNYSVGWPLNILLTDDLLFNYEKLFTFQMRLYRAELLLLGISSFLKFKGSKSRQIPIIHHYRYRMLHLVRSVRHYINVTVIHCAWTELAASFHKMTSLDKLYEGLVRHIKFVTTNCLLGTKGEGVKKLLLDQLTVIECFCKEVEDYNEGVNWDTGEEIPAQSFARLHQKFKVWEEIQKVFIQVFFKLANKGIYQKVSYFLQLFNFNGYFGNNLIE